MNVTSKVDPVLLNFIFDFGSLLPEDEKNAIDAMLQGDKAKNRKAQDTAAFLEAAGLAETSKIDVYDDETLDDDMPTDEQDFLKR